MGFLLVLDDGSPSVRKAAKALRNDSNTIIVPLHLASHHVERKPDVVVAPGGIAGTNLWDQAESSLRCGYGAPEDMERVFLLGADDYLCSPWTEIELTVRIYRLLQKRREVMGNVITIGDESFVLSRIHAVLWHALSQRPGVAVERERLFELVMNPEVRGGLRTDQSASSRAIDIQISRLRRVLGTYGRLIETVRGKGYRLISETVNISNLNVEK